MNSNGFSGNPIYAVPSGIAGRIILDPTFGIGSINPKNPINAINNLFEGIKAFTSEGILINDSTIYFRSRDVIIAKFPDKDSTVVIHQAGGIMFKIKNGKWQEYIK
jgi:hypothetical protein